MSTLEIARSYIGKNVAVTVDRPMGSTHPKHGFVYPINYGYIAGVKSGDGEDLDAYCLRYDGPAVQLAGTCVAVIHREDDDDDKLVVVPAGVSMSDNEILAAVGFQEKWFKSSVVRK
ncbi:MAG TPA: inorganic diphosphatase [Candidatus Paceibacterota bacterium]